MKDNLPEQYLAFLLRLWREDVKAPWRAMLENPHTDERHGFADLEELIAFLQKITAVQAPEGGDSFRNAGRSWRKEEASHDE